MAEDKDNKPKYRKLNGNDFSKEERDALMRNYGPQFGSSQDFTRVGSFGSLIYESEFNIKSGGSAYYAHPITEIRSLTRVEEWFFEGKGFVSPHFCVQVLYKVKGYVTRSAFRLALYKLVESNPNLRAGYCDLGKRTVKVIFKDRQFLVNYQNINSLSEESIQKTLDKLIEKDRLQGFDLVHGPLFRITIFHTQEMRDKLLGERLNEQGEDGEVTGILDKGIVYLTDANTLIGSQIQRLNLSEANIVTKAENAQAAESVIRDADMAKEMVNFTKNNILMQASQAMMSQANQNASGVLGLLQ